MDRNKRYHQRLHVTHTQCHMFSHVERTEKIPIGSIRTVISEPIKDNPDYHIMVQTMTLY